MLHQSMLSWRCLTATQHLAKNACSPLTVDYNRINVQVVTFVMHVMITQVPWWNEIFFGSQNFIVFPFGLLHYLLQSFFLEVIYHKDYNLCHSPVNILCTYANANLDFFVQCIATAQALCNVMMCPQKMTHVKMLFRYQVTCKSLFRTIVTLLLSFI